MEQVLLNSETEHEEDQVAAIEYLEACKSISWLAGYIDAQIKPQLDVICTRIWMDQELRSAVERRDDASLPKIIVEMC